MMWAGGGEQVDVLRVEALRVGYGQAALLEQVNVVCEPGKICAIVGVNGVGKSTMLRVMAGVESARAGSVRIGELEVTRDGGKRLARRRAYMEQGGVTEFDYTVEEVVMMGEYAWRRGWGPQGRAASARVARYLERVELSGYEHRSVMRLSGGEHRRVMMARVMATRAGWWLLDEPLASLDMRVQKVVMDAMAAHCDEGGGVVMVCHDLNWVMARCDHVVVCHDGGVWAQGRPEEVLTQEAIEEVFGVMVRCVGEGVARRFIHQREIEIL